MEWLCCSSGRNLRLSIFFLHCSTVTSSLPPSINFLLLSFSSILLYSPSPSFSTSTPFYTFIFPPPDFVRAPPISSCGNMLRDFGQIWWCSLPTVAFNQLKSYFGDEQRGSCLFFFHELLYNRITQPEGQDSHHGGLRRSSCLKMNFEYCLCWLTDGAWLQLCITSVITCKNVNENWN